MARPSEHSREDFIAAALHIVDSEGLDALTLRRLGSELGVSHTAVYTNFENRDQIVAALVNQMGSEIVAGVAVDGVTPHDILMAVGMATRRAMGKHPLLVPAFAQADSDIDEGEYSSIQLVSGVLAQAGLHGEKLSLAYRAIESYILGATIFDLGAAPRHLAIRRRRYKRSSHPDFAAAAKTEKTMAAHNDEAFVLGLNSLLTALGV